MARWSSIRPVLAGLTAVMGLGVLPACNAVVPDYGCSERDEQFASTLSTLAIFGVHPDDVTELDSYSGCDPDDGFAYAGKKYLAPLGRNDVLNFYRTAAPKDDWHFEGDQAPPGPDQLVITVAGSCYSKTVDGTTAYLKIWFPGDLDDEENSVPVPTAATSSQSVYGIEVTASHDGGTWC